MFFYMRGGGLPNVMSIPWGLGDWDPALVGTTGPAADMLQQ